MTHNGQEGPVPPRRAFDHDLLRRFMQANPQATDYELARALTEDNRRSDPAAPEVNPASVRNVLRNKRAVWGVPPRQPHHEGRVPRGMLNPAHSMDQPMRYWRDLQSRDEGHVPETMTAVKLRGCSTVWEARMREERMVLDVDAGGVPIVREARTEELGPDGYPLSLAAWLIPGWRGKNVL